MVQSELILDLQTLNQISQTLNQATDVQTALNASLAQLVDLMGVETGWVFVRDADASDRWGGRGFRLAAHHNLPPALAVTEEEAWDKDCDCQTLCREGKLEGAYNEVRCSRLGSVMGDRRGLVVHASAALRSGSQVLGILNVAAPNWSSFTPRSLTLLANVGSQMGIALERARLFDALQVQRIHEQAALLDLSQQLLSRRDVDDLMTFIVHEVRSLLSADACAILLKGPGADHLHFRAASGWRSDPVARGHLVPAEARTGSRQVMETQQALVIPELNDEPTLWSADWLRAEGFRAVAIVPLVADGESIGTLIIDSREPRQFTDLEVRFLRLMANQAAIAIENARLHEEELRRQRIEDELEVGRQIQMSMLPPELPRLPGWDFAADFEAARQVGGDFYDYFALPGDPGRLGIVIADVSDKGVPAALFMALSRTTIRNVALRGRPPAEVISWANRFIQEDSQSDMFLTAFYAELDTATGRLTYANAGHNPPLWWRAATHDFNTLPGSCPLLGVLDDLTVEATVVDLAPGDVLVLYTDGITESVNRAYQEFGRDRLEETVRRALEATPGPTADELRHAVVQAVERYADNMIQYDDMTLLIIKRTETAGAH